MFFPWILLSIDTFYLLFTPHAFYLHIILPWIMFLVSIPLIYCLLRMQMIFPVPKQQFLHTSSLCLRVRSHNGFTATTKNSALRSRKNTARFHIINFLTHGNMSRGRQWLSLKHGLYDQSRGPHKSSYRWQRESEGRRGLCREGKNIVFSPVLPYLGGRREEVQGGREGGGEERTSEGEHVGIVRKVC